MKRILFVDDEMSILDGLKRMLRPQRHEWDMSFAPGAEAALTLMEASPFDVIVTDMRMPGMDGAALLEIVREKYPNVLRIILSGYTELQASLRAVPVAHQFLLKPCDPEVLRAGIARATSLGEVLDSKMISSLVGSLRDLPSLPGTYLDLRQALSQSNTTIDRVVQIVEKDVAVAAKILQLVNSAFFGLARDVTDLKTAVNCLGMNTIHDLVLSVEVFRSFKPNDCVPESFVRDFHEHSQLAARIATGITRKHPMSAAAAVASLLHDVGKLVIAERTPDHFARSLAQSLEENVPLFEVEEKLTRISHAEVGAYLLSLWGLPHGVVEGVAHHHHPQRIPHTELDIPLVVYLSNLLAQEVRATSKAETPYPFHPIDTAFLEKVGIAGKLPEWRKIAEESAMEIRATAPA
jgi:putative nucleotidyltransferase with HDIG domain